MSCACHTRPNKALQQTAYHAASLCGKRPAEIGRCARKTRDSNGATQDSDIIIEIAKQGLSCEKYAHSKVMHALMALAHIAWNRETVSESYTPREQYIGFINQLRLSAKSIRRELVSEDWEAIISRMRAYKRQHFQNDRRVITACGFTERETLQVQWHDGAQQTHQRGK